jgi:acyl carrier protein
MGLELVELILTVEENYGLSIPDTDIASIDTAGKLYDYILAHRFAGAEDGCLTSVAFYRLRRAMMSVLGVSRKDVQTAANLTAMIPARRRQVWRELQTALALRLPPLRRPAWVTAVATLAVLAAAIAAGVQRNLFVALVVACAVGYVLRRVTEPLAVEPGPEFATVGQLVKEIVAMNFAALSDQCRRSSAVELWESLRNLIADELGVQRSDVTKESHFVKDFGAG